MLPFAGRLVLNRRETCDMSNMLKHTIIEAFPANEKNGYKVETSLRKNFSFASVSRKARGFTCCGSGFASAAFAKLPRSCTAETGLCKVARCRHSAGGCWNTPQRRKRWGFLEQHPVIVVEREPAISAQERVYYACLIDVAWGRCFGR